MLTYVDHYWSKGPLRAPADRNSGAKSGARNPDGTFAPGNPGKPRGSRHRATQATLALLDGEAEALTRKAVEMALAGDSAALRVCLERIAPPRKDAPVEFALPVMASAQDATTAAAAILTAVANAELTPAEGSHVMALVDAYRRTLEATELETRIIALEQRK
ncbi:hypothetical protein [Limimaricola cinnabarinus]|uniref:hypothetical protein n=1 Tax=Limimaricola cinnabarinus TaxID=1125964 RepID=UPI0020B11122|nr:hypothetical protein [Limimaricola cinnabarinus]